MARQHIHIRGTAEADTAAIWRLLGDSSTWPSWTPIETFDLERPGAADGLGEVRVFRTGRIRVREEIVEVQPNRRLSYQLLSGLAVRNYRSEVELTPRMALGPAVTDISWQTSFSSRVPGLGRLYRKAIASATQEFVDGLAKHSADSDHTTEKGETVNDTRKRVQKLTSEDTEIWSKVGDQQIFVSDIIDQATNPEAKMTVGYARVGEGETLTSSFPYDEVLILTKGAGYTVHTEHGEALTVRAGEVIYLPAESKNSFYAEEDTEMVYVANPPSVYADHVAASIANHTSNPTKD